MQPKDGANGIELPGRLSFSLSSFYFIPSRSSAPQPPCSRSQPSVHPAFPLSLETRKKLLVSSNSNRQQQPANLRVQSRVVGGRKKAEETAFSKSVLPIVLFLNQTDMMMMTMTTE